MKAFGYKQPLPILNTESLLDIEIPRPTPGPRDLLVRIHAVSVNPAGAKLRASSAPAAGEEYRILGFDAAGVVDGVGSEVGGNG